MSSLSLSVSGSPLLYHIFTALPLSGSSSRWALDLKILNESLQLYLKDKPSMHTTLRCCRNRALILSDFSLTPHDDQLKWVIFFLFAMLFQDLCYTCANKITHNQTAKICRCCLWLWPSNMITLARHVHSCHGGSCKHSKLQKPWHARQVVPRWFLRDDWFSTS